MCIAKGKEQFTLRSNFFLYLQENWDAHWSTHSTPHMETLLSQNNSTRIMYINITQ